MSTSEQHTRLVALVRRWLADFNTGDTSAAPDIVAARFTEHALAPFGDREPGEVDGVTHHRNAVAWLRAQFPDIAMRDVAVVTDGDMAAALVETTGTNLGPLNGAGPTTGRAFAARQSHWFRVQDGRLVEHWATRDDLGAMLQLGVVARPPAAPAP